MKLYFDSSHVFRNYFQAICNAILFIHFFGRVRNITCFEKLREKELRKRGENERKSIYKHIRKKVASGMCGGGKSVRLHFLLSYQIFFQFFFFISYHFFLFEKLEIKQFFLFLFVYFHIKLLYQKNF